MLRKKKAGKLTLRPYQQECIDAIDSLAGGAHLVQMATGLGKTVTFANIHRHGRMLILSHRDELVTQPVRYFDCPVGIERAKDRSAGEEVVSASVQTLASPGRLERAFRPGDFDIVVTDEAHHALAPSYRAVIDYLKPRLHIGFTATPNRGDGKGLDEVFDDIVFQRDLIWGIRNGFLSDIDCKTVTVGWSTKDVKRRAGDFALGALDTAVNRPETNAQVAEAYERFHRGQTLIFAASVDHAHALAGLIDGAVAVDGKTPTEERRRIVADFTARKIPCLVNYGVFTEGTDLPLIETVLIARPTENAALYTQMVGRGLRLYTDPETGEKKESLLLIDCAGDSETNDICSPPTLVGIDPKGLAGPQRRAVDGRLTGMRDRILASEDTPEGWILSAHSVNLAATASKIAWVRRGDGSRVLSGRGWKVEMTQPDLLGAVAVTYRGFHKTVRPYESVNQAEREVLGWLENHVQTRGDRHLWDPKQVSRWANRPATDSQKKLVKDLLGKDLDCIDLDNLSKIEARTLIDNGKTRRDEKLKQIYGCCPVCGAALMLSRDNKSFTCTTNTWRRGPAGWTRVGGCGTTFRVRADGHCISAADLQGIREKGYYTWRNRRYVFHKSKYPNGFATIDAEADR